MDSPYLEPRNRTGGETELSEVDLGNQLKREAGVADAVCVYGAPQEMSRPIQSFEQVRDRLADVLIDKIIGIELDGTESYSESYGRAGYPEIQQLCHMICKLYGVDIEGAR